MSDAPFSKEQEITPSGPEQLSDAQVDAVAGGIVIHGNAAPLQEAGLIDPVHLRWTCRI